ncbi:MAG: cation diffusion facilitator family transporter [Bacteroidota bacterium]|nr:cation diffusion facilitator family transporter [Bacteroidota bacterium]
MSQRSFLKKFAWLSVAAAIATIGLKSLAYVLTGSVGLLSDAVESLVNLVGALMALGMLTVAARPADDEHVYGHGKAEYFSSGVEGVLILIAAISIGITAAQRFISPRPLEQIGLGLLVSVGASLVNLITALIIRRAGKRYQSITLEANAQHLMTDVWTSAGVLVGVGAVAFTGWERLDPVVAIFVALNIVWSGILIVRKSVQGLMDIALPKEELEKVQKVLDAYKTDEISFHALRTRQAGARRFVSVHVIVPGQWTVHEGHQLLERIENDMRKILNNGTIFTHLESADDPASWADIALDRN